VSAASLPQKEFAGLSLFFTGWESHASHLVFGRYGDTDLYLFEFASKSGPQMNDPETTQTVVAVRSETLPRFRVAPAPRIFGLAEGSAEERIELEAEAWPGDERRRTFSDAVLGLATERPGWHMESNGHWLVLWQTSRIVSPSGAGSFLDEALGMNRTISSAANTG